MAGVPQMNLHKNKGSPFPQDFPGYLELQHDLVSHSLHVLHDLGNYLGLCRPIIADKMEQQPLRTLSDCCWPRVLPALISSIPEGLRSQTEILLVVQFTHNIDEEEALPQLS